MTTAQIWTVVTADLTTLRGSSTTANTEVQGYKTMGKAALWDVLDTTFRPIIVVSAANQTLRDRLGAAIRTIALRL